MTWKHLRRSLRLLTALSLTVSLAGCVSAEQKMRDAARKKAAADQVGAALESAGARPPLPSDCRKLERSGVKVGDRLDIALVKTDAALGRANQRVTRCAGWYDEQSKPRG